MESKIKRHYGGARYKGSIPASSAGGLLRGPAVRTRTHVRPIQ